MSFVRFSDKQKEQACRTDLAELLRSQGETIRQEGGMERGLAEGQYLGQSVILSV